MADKNNDNRWPTTGSLLLYLGIALSGGSGAYTALTVDDSDRYRASSAEKDFALRDAEIARIKVDLARLEREIIAHERRIDEIERKYDLHTQRHPD